MILLVLAPGRKKYYLGVNLGQVWKVFRHVLVVSITSIINSGVVFRYQNNKTKIKIVT